MWCMLFLGSGLVWIGILLVQVPLQKKRNDMDLLPEMPRCFFMLLSDESMPTICLTRHLAELFS